MAQKQEKCAHPSCVCPRTKDSKYCSTYCQDAKDTMELSCNCGHAGCGTDAMVTEKTETVTGA